MTQAGCYQLVLDRKLGEYHLPEGSVVVAAGNPASERGVHFSMPRPLRNRFVHLNLEPDFEDWCPCPAFGWPECFRRGRCRGLTADEQGGRGQNEGCSQDS